MARVLAPGLMCTRARSAVALAALSALTSGACGGGQTRGSPFDPGWIDDHGAGMATFERSFRGTRVSLGADVAIGVLGKEALVGAPLDGSAPWTFTHALRGRPAIAGSVVVASGGGEIFALDARSGKLLWSRASGGRVRGAGDDGTTTVVSLIPIAGFGSVVLAIARDGSVVRQIEDEGAIGVPAVAGDTVFLPWQGRFLSVYDLPSGDERARIALPGKVSRALAIGGAIWAGETSITRFDERLARAGARDATTLSLPAPLGGLLGDPAWTRSGTEWVSREADARDRAQLLARPAASGRGFARDRFAATFHRAALGFEAQRGALAWARLHDAELIGGAAYEGGFALCDARGEVTLVDAETGLTTSRVTLGKPIEACVVSADALRASPPKGAPRPLAEQIAEVVGAPDPELAPLRRALAKLGEGAAGSPSARPE